MEGKTSDSTEERVDEVRQLRGCINDLISLLALPAMWSDRKPPQIIETLLDTLIGILRLDLIYARLKSEGASSPIEAVRFTHYQPAIQPQEIGRVLAPWLAADTFALPLTIPNPIGEGKVNLARFSLGLLEEAGQVMACSRRADFPTETETFLLRVAVNQAAIALKGAQLARLREQAEISLREQTEVVETINRIGQTLSAELDQQKLVQALTDAAIELTGAKFGSFFYNVADERGESYMLYTLSGVPREAFAHFPMPRNTDIFGPTFRGEGVIRLVDVKQDPRYGKNSPYYGMPAGHLPVTSYLAIPVISRSGEVLGGLFFGHPEAGVFTDRHERIIVGLAAQAAIAMDNARLFNLLERERAEAQAAQKQVANILESITDSFIAFDKDWRFTYVNREAEKLLLPLKVPGSDVLGKNLWDTFPNLVSSVVYEQFQHAMTMRVSVECEMFYPPVNSWLHIRAYPSYEGLTVYVQDITARKQAEQARANLAAIVESSDDAIVSKNLQGIIRSWNKGAEKLFGYTASETIGQPVTMLFPPQFIDEEPRILEKIGRGETIDHYETVRQRKDGTLIDISLTVSPIRDQAGNIIGASKIARDITERKQAEDRIAADLEAMTRLQEVGNLCMRSGNEFGQCLEAITAAAVALTGADKGNMQLLDPVSGTLSIATHINFEKPFLDFFASVRDEASACATAMQAAERVIVEDVTKSEIFALQPSLQVLLHAGVRAVQSTPLMNSTGSVLGMISTHFGNPHHFSERELRLMDLLARQAADYLERKQAEEALRASESQLQTLINEVPLGLYVVDGDFRIRKVSPTALPAFGDIPDLIGKDFGEVIRHLWDKKYADEIVNIFRHTLETGEPYFTPERAEKRLDSGLTEYYEWQVNRIPLPEGGYGIVCYFRDISSQVFARLEREKLLAAEREARSNADTASRAKDEFLATVSHELRSPLNAMLGWARLLGGGNLSEEAAARGIKAIEQNAKAQAQLIEDLLDVSRIISGKFRLNNEPIDVPRVIEAAIDSVRPTADIKGVRLQVTLDSEAGPVSGDAGRLQQVVWNLLSNSVKFTPRDGRVQVRLFRINSHIEIEVSDTGQGIAPEFLPYVFDRFRQADGSSTRSHGGLGLGLSIVRHIVELHGGNVTAYSPGIGLGATFTIKLPLMVVHSKPTGERRVHPSLDKEMALSFQPSLSHKETALSFQPSLSLEGVRVLAIDDEAEALLLLSTVLTQCGAIVKTASSAEEGFREVQVWRPDVIVSDIGMPGEDGYAFMMRVKTWMRKTGIRIPAVALTAFARTEDRMKALASGYQIHVPKPVEPAELITVVVSLVEKV
jgi:PAS domain S-box-containing protein